MPLESSRGGLRRCRCSHSPLFVVRRPLGFLLFVGSILVCFRIVQESLAAEFSDQPVEGRAGEEDATAQGTEETGDKVLQRERQKEKAETEARKKAASKALARLKDAEARIKDLSIKVLLKDDLEPTIQEVIEQADENDTGRLTWVNALESHRESLAKRGKVSMDVSFVAKAKRLGDPPDAAPQAVGYLLGRVEADGVIIQKDQTLDELPVPLGARLMSRFLEAASKEAGKTLRVTAYTDSFNLGACQAFNQLGLYPIEASFGELMGGQERGVNYKWISTVPYTHPNGFIEKLVEKERQKKENLEGELRKVCRSDRQFEEALRGKDWLSRHGVVQVEKDQDTMLDVQQWISQRQEFSSDIGIFTENKLEFRVCFVARSRYTKMILGVIHGQYPDKNQKVVEMGLLLEAMGDAKTGLYLLDAALSALPPSVERVQALLPCRELGTMQAILQTGMTFSGLDGGNAIFGMMASRDKLDFKRLRLHKARLDLRCESEQLQQTLESIITAEKKKRKAIGEKAKTKEEAKVPHSETGPPVDPKGSVPLPFPLKEPSTDIPVQPLLPFSGKHGETEPSETDHPKPTELSKISDEKLTSRKEPDEASPKDPIFKQEEFPSGKTDADDRPVRSGVTLSAILALAVAFPFAFYLLKKQKNRGKATAKRRDTGSKVAKTEAENDNTSQSSKKENKIKYEMQAEPVQAGVSRASRRHNR